MSIDEITTEVLRLDADATPGPWNWTTPPSEDSYTCVWDDHGDPVVEGNWEGNTALIAYYRTAAPVLAREVQRLQGQIERLHGQGCDCHFDRYRTWRKGHREGQEAMLTRCRDAIGSLPDYPACCTCSHDRRRSRSHSDPHCEGWQDAVDRAESAIRAMEVAHD